MSKSKTTCRAAAKNAAIISKSATPATDAPTRSPAVKPPRQTEAALLRTRLLDPNGASLTSLMEITGWQAHTLRAALTGLPKSGITISRRRQGEETIYKIEAAELRTAVGDGHSGSEAGDLPPMVRMRTHDHAGQS